MERLSLNLIHGSIYNIIKFYILNSGTIDYEKSKKKFQDNFNLLDNSAIFLRITNQNLDSDFVENYKKNHLQIEKDREEKNKIINEVKKLEKKINNIIISYDYESNKSSKILGLDSSLLIGQEVKTIFLNDEINIKSLENLKKFHTVLLSNHGRYIDKPNEKNFNIKTGHMFQYYELSDLLLSEINKLISKFQEYENNINEKEKFKQSIYSILDKIINDLNSLTTLNDELLKSIINDVDVFLGDKK